MLKFGEKYPKTDIVATPAVGAVCVYPDGLWGIMDVDDVAFLEYNNASPLLPAKLQCNISLVELLNQYFWETDVYDISRYGFIYGEAGKDSILFRLTKEVLRTPEECQELLLLLKNFETLLTWRETWK